MGGSGVLVGGGGIAAPRDWVRLGVAGGDEVGVAGSDEVGVAGSDDSGEDGSDDSGEADGDGVGVASGVEAADDGTGAGQTVSL